MNRERKKIDRQPSPFSSASFLSKWTFWWLKPMLGIGLSRTIEEDDIYAVTNCMQSNRITQEFDKLWELELKKRKPSLLRVILKVHGLKMFLIGLLYALGEILARVIQPICLGYLVSYFAQSDNSQITSAEAYCYATGIVLSMAFTTFTLHPFLLFNSKTASKVRIACSGLIYRKILRITKSSIGDGQNGQIINLLSNDLSNLESKSILLYEIYAIPIEMFAYFIVIYMEIGVAAIFGMTVLVALAPLQVYMSNKVGQLSMKKTKRTDVRVRIMNEILLGIQIIKMYAWEKSFAKLVDQIRKKEMKVVRSMAFILSITYSCKALSEFALFLSLGSYILFGNAITARRVFIVSSYFSMLSYLSMSIWPYSITCAAEVSVAINRVQEFLLKSEKKILDNTLSDQTIGNENNDTRIILDKDRRKSSEKFEEDRFIYRTTDPINRTICRRVQNVNSSDKFIRFQKAKAVWGQSECEKANGVHDLSLDIKTGLWAIVGHVGSGKSTLLNVLLGELDMDDGLITINGSISYASQDPWIFEGSVRSNIVFVEDFDEQRYNKVIEVCALERDFLMLPQGDATIVGERGSSLSGGQRARVNLARAIYKQSDIYLLDDPLSAVDTNVGKHIFEQCIKEFLADKICVLVTHQLQYLKDEHHVVLLNNGRIDAEKQFEALEKFDKKISNHANEEKLEREGEKTDIQKSSTSFINSEQTKLDTTNRTETKATGSVTFNTYKKFFQAVNSLCFVIFVLSSQFLDQLAWSGLSFFISEWVDWEDKVAKVNVVNETIIELNSTESIQYETITELNLAESFQSIDQTRKMYLISYLSIIIFATICILSRTFSLFTMCVKVSINLHDMIFRGVVRAKMTFFNQNPSGRILNRFAGDISNVDSMLPLIMFDVLEFLLKYLVTVTIAVIINPWSLIPVFLMTIFFYLLRKVFINTGRSLKRIEALSRSPVYSHVNATLQGLSTIRSFGAGKILESEFHEFQDHNTSSLFLFICASRWFAMCLDVVCLLFVAFVTYSCIIFEDSMNISSGKVGLVILSSIQLASYCQYGIRQIAELENQMISVERIIEYAELPSESALESHDKNSPPTNWPSDGNLEFKELSMRYYEDSDPILRDMTFRIDAKQKIGVVGRTGAGKSSIIQSIFRLAQNEGQILIDGVDIGMIGLHDLRKKISIIPQEAVLFSGSLRFNLDPFGERTDDELWSSLEQVELKSVVLAMPDGLDSKILDGGLNFSAGQRQLLCLARAILRNNKILILDEATASVDSETDKLIQETIRSRFADCTVITIAHRLDTIMDSDKVLVVDAGQVVEFDHPFELIQKTSGAFKFLLDHTDISTAISAKENIKRNTPAS